MFLVDTNVVSDARRQRPEVVRWLRSVEPRSIYLSVITLGEINRGALALQPKDPRSAGHLLIWLNTLRQEYRQRTLPITDDVAVEWGRISARRPRGTGDGLIAATAAVHGLIVVTRNIADFGDAGVPVLDPWDAPHPV